MEDRQKNITPTLKAVVENIPRIQGPGYKNHFLNFRKKNRGIFLTKKTNRKNKPSK